MSEHTFTKNEKEILRFLYDRPTFGYSTWEQIPAGRRPVAATKTGRAARTLQAKQVVELTRTITDGDGTICVWKLTNSGRITAGIMRARKEL